MKAKFMMMAAAAMVLAACSNDENETANDGPVELRLTSGLEVQQTRANTQSTSILDGETVYAWADEVTSSSTPEYIKAWKLTAGSNNALTGSSQFFPQSGNSLNIYALHGNFGSDVTFTENTTAFPSPSLTHTVETDQTPGTDNSNIVNYAKSDLLYARAMDVNRTGASSNVKTQKLTFYHMLSKVEVALVSGTGNPSLTDATVTIENTKLKATFTPDKSKDITDETSGQNNRAGMIKLLETGNDVAPITIGNTTSENFNEGTTINYNEAILVPQVVASGTGVQFIKVQLKDNAALYYKVSNLQLESGKKYTYHITVDLTGLKVTSEIEDWAPVAAVPGSATLE